MIKEKVLIFGSTGQIGRHLIRKLTKNNYKVTCQTRNSHKAIFLKTSGSIGYIEIVEANIFDEKKLNELIKDCDVCINLIGILYETKNQKARIACALSHYLLWEQCLMLDKPILILEHDSVFIKKIDFLPEDTGYDIITNHQNGGQGVSGNAS